MKKFWKIHTKNVLIILLGACIFSIGINCFAITNHLAEGGFTGIALILYYLFDLSTGVVIFVLNIPLLFIGYKIFGKRTFYYTLIGIFAVSFFLEVTKNVGGFKTNDLLFVALYTGVFAGTGLGMIFRVGGTTGGSDIIARLANKYLGWSIGRTFLIFDFAVIAASAYYFGLKVAMYTLVAVFVGSKIIDFVVEGLSESKAAMIISEAPLVVAEEITKRMGRGVTILNGRGGFTGAEKQVVYAVFAPNELPKLKHIVLKADPYAFVVVHDVREVHGEGFSFQAHERIPQLTNK
ncbi:YitT family protein [Risungbinella massiliensis]|uniref:YitT family protein n=1 Tax=Risungbinella massiliensis TaxID=1329796 RepID=UPI0005CB9994|nr:YitT family protein [Risungbinella massiliensis]